MADGTWLLQDTPIFWFAAGTTPTPPVRLGGYTSYDLALTVPDVFQEPLPEVAAQVARGDQRYMRPR